MCVRTCNYYPIEYTTKDSELILSFYSVRMITASTPYYKEIIDVLKRPQFQGMDTEADSKGYARYSPDIEAGGH